MGFAALAQVTGPMTHGGSREEATPSGTGIRAEVTLALVNVTATDPYGRLVTGLETENFHIFADGIEQEIVAFSSEDVPVSIGLIFDMSGSMSDKVEKARQAAVQFLQTANPRDEFFLVSFGDRAELTRPFTSNVEDLQNGMLYTTARGRTALFDGIYLGLSQMRGARNSKRALLIISYAVFCLKKKNYTLIHRSNPTAHLRYPHYGSSALAALRIPAEERN